MYLCTFLSPSNQDSRILASLENVSELYTEKLALFPISKLPISFSRFKIFAGSIVKAPKASSIFRPRDIALRKFFQKSSGVLSHYSLSILYSHYSLANKD